MTATIKAKVDNTINAEVGAKSAGRARAPASRPKTPRQARQTKSPKPLPLSGAILEAASTDAAPADGTPMSSSTVSREAAAPAVSKTARLLVLLSREGGATIADLCEATGWQQHSVRGAMAGALKKKGHVVTSTKQDGMRRYKLGAAS